MYIVLYIVYTYIYMYIYEHIVHIYIYTIVLRKTSIQNGYIFKGFKTN